MKAALRLVFQVSSVDRIVNEMKVASSEAAKPAESETAQIERNEGNPVDTQAAPSAAIRSASRMPQSPSN